MLVHTGQDTSSRRLWSNVLISMSSKRASKVTFSRNSTGNNEALWQLSFFSYSWNQLFVMTMFFVV